MWAETEDAGGDLYPRRQGSVVRGRRDLRRPPSLYPQRVPPHLIVQQQSPPVARGSPASRLRAEHSQSPAAAPSDDSMDMEESSSELGAGKQVSALSLAVEQDTVSRFILISTRNLRLYIRTNN